MPQNDSILLTGGAGFIGSHVAEALLRRSAHLTILDNLNNFYSPGWKRANLQEIRRLGDFEFVQADICDFEALRAAVELARPRAVIHLAARAGVRPSIAEPLLYERVNVAGTLNLLELCRRTGVGKFVFASSSSVYGAASRAPFLETEADLRPISPYAATKLSGELLSYTYARLFGFPVICLRLFTVYGPRQRPDLAIHKFTALIEKGQPIPIFGDGSSGRDYTYIDDIVAGVLAALDYKPELCADVPFEVFNLGSSRPVKLNELVELLERVSERKAVRHYCPAQTGDLLLTWADTTKARRLLGYQPTTPIEVGLRRFLEWYRAVEAERRLAQDHQFSLPIGSTKGVKSPDVVQF